MRVLVLNSRLSPRGGADRWLLSVLARLQQLVTTRLLVGYSDRDLPSREAERIGPWARLKGLDRRGGRRRGQSGLLRRLEQELAAFAPDVVQVNDVTEPAVLARVARGGRGVMMVQDHRFFCPGRGKVDAEGLVCEQAMGPGCVRCFDDPNHAEAMLELTHKRLDAVRGMAAVTVLSRYMAGELARAGVNKAHIHRLPPFVDNAVDNIDNPLKKKDFQGRYHLLAGRLCQAKGVDVALEAASLLRTRLPLWVAGEGAMADQVRRATMAEDGRVHHLGWLDHGALAKTLDHAASLWLPGRWAEPFGIIGLEAQARGVPVIATNVGGVADWLQHKKTGLLVPPGDAEALAQAADNLAEDPNLAQTLATAAHDQRKKNHDPDAIIDHLLTLYKNVGSGGQTRPH